MFNIRKRYRVNTYLNFHGGHMLLRTSHCWTWSGAVGAFHNALSWGEENRKPGRYLVSIFFVRKDGTLKELKTKEFSW